MIHFNGNKPVHNYLAPLRLCFMQLPNFTLTNPRTSSPAEKIGTILTTLHKLNSLDELPEALRHDPLVERLVAYCFPPTTPHAHFVYILRMYIPNYLLSVFVFPRAAELLSRAKLSREEVADYEYSLKHARDEYAVQKTIEAKERANEEMKRANEEMKRANEEKDRANEEMKRANEEMKRAIEGMKRDLVEQEKPKTG